METKTHGQFVARYFDFSSNSHLNSLKKIRQNSLSVARHGACLSRILRYELYCRSLDVLTCERYGKTADA